MCSLKFTFEGTLVSTGKSIQALKKLYLSLPNIQSKNKAVSTRFIPFSKKF